MTQPVPLNTAMVNRLAQALGINSVSELGRRAGIDRTYLSRILRSERPCQPSQLIGLARALRAEPIELLAPLDPAGVLAEALADDDAAEEVPA